MSEKSNVTKEWIEGAWAKYPPKKLENGNIVFGPVRLAFVNLVGEQKKTKAGNLKSWGAVLLFPDCADLKLLKTEATAKLKEKAPLALTNKAIAEKYHNPFKKQDSFVDTKTGNLYEGFVEGRTAISMNSPGSQPPVVNQRLAPVIDEKSCYSGVWAMVTASPCSWFKVDGNEGPNFYLQSVMIVQDDESLGGSGSSNPNKDFEGINLSSDVNPAAAFGAADTNGEEPVDIFA